MSATFALNSTFRNECVGRFIFYLKPHFQVSDSNGSIHVSNANKNKS